MASSPTDGRLLLQGVRNADKVTHTGDASPVQRVKMMVRLAHEVNAAVGLVDAPAFVHKAGILRAALPAGAQLAFEKGIDMLERFLVPRYTQLWACMPPYDAFLLLMVTILELFALGVLWSLRTLRRICHL